MCLFEKIPRWVTGLTGREVAICGVLSAGVLLCGVVGSLCDSEYRVSYYYAIMEAHADSFTCFKLSRSSLAAYSAAGLSIISLTSDYVELSKLVRSVWSAVSLRTN